LNIESQHINITLLPKAVFDAGLGFRVRLGFRFGLNSNLYS
jgi:hypothetical protein